MERGRVDVIYVVPRIRGFRNRIHVVGQSRQGADLDYFKLGNANLSGNMVPRSLLQILYRHNSLLLMHTNIIVLKGHLDRNNFGAWLLVLDLDPLVLIPYLGRSITIVRNQLGHHRNLLVFAHLVHSHKLLLLDDLDDRLWLLICIVLIVAGVAIGLIVGLDLVIERPIGVLGLGDGIAQVNKIIKAFLKRFHHMLAAFALFLIVQRIWRNSRLLQLKLRLVWMMVIHIISHRVGQVDRVQIRATDRMTK
mmetsp:Transcript_10105/g.17299  ORF Transcript_10105/g.17299 Transcript_10105/m.17299 type:complete len:250 (+) Transcript_10105:380-1129(+)